MISRAFIVAATIAWSWAAGRIGSGPWVPSTGAGHGFGENHWIGVSTGDNVSHGTSLVWPPIGLALARRLTRASAGGDLDDASVAGRATTWVVTDAEGEPVALSVQDVARLADLARIEMSQDQLAALAPQLDVILESVAVVGQVAEQDIPPTSHAIAMTNVFRDDVVTPSWPAEAMLVGAPAVEDSQFRAPRILDEEA